MLFREFREPSPVLTIEEKNAASIEKINEINMDMKRTDDPEELFDLYGQKREQMHLYDMRNGLVEKRPGIVARIGKSAVGWVKDIPGRMIHPG